MLFRLNKNGVLLNILGLSVFILLVSIVLPYWYALSVNTIPVSLIVVNLSSLREKRVYEIENNNLLYKYNDKEIMIPLIELDSIRKHVLFRGSFYNQYFVHFDGYDYEISAQYENLQGKSIVDVLIKDYKLNVQSVRGLKLVVKVKKEESL